MAVSNPTPTPIRASKRQAEIPFVASQVLDLAVDGSAETILVFKAGSGSVTLTAFYENGDVASNVLAVDSVGVIYGSAASITLANGLVLHVDTLGCTHLRLTFATSTTGVLVPYLAMDRSASLVGGLTAASQVIGSPFAVSPTTFTVGTAAYIAGDLIGGILTFANAHTISGRSVLINSVYLHDLSHQSIPCTFEWFRATPVGGTYTDGAAGVYATADYTTSANMTRIVASDWINYPATPTAGKAARTGLDTQVPLTGTSLFALLWADASFSLTAGDLKATVSGVRL